MEGIHSAGPHQDSLDGRRKGMLTGITEVLSFDAELVILATKQGKLTIKGHELQVIRLDVEKGELEFSGRVDSMIYSEIKSAGQMTTGVLKRLFK